MWWGMVQELHVSIMASGDPGWGSLLGARETPMTRGPPHAFPSSKPRIVCTCSSLAVHSAQPQSASLNSQFVQEGGTLSYPQGGRLVHIPSGHRGGMEAERLACRTFTRSGNTFF